MCAINGFNFRDEDLIVRMNKATAHRGPDRTGIFLGDGVSLGHNRLSIIDLSFLADQPMKSANGRLAIVFNGEIYNFKELRDVLRDYYPFSTNSDTEVILAAYQQWGRDCVNRLDGIFAFAIWEIEERKLFLARDHLGVKPLYYFWDGALFIFSSEIKAILQHNLRRTLDQETFNLYLRVLYVPGPRTMLQGIKKLAPAHRAFFFAGQLSIDQYWQVVQSPEYIDSSRSEAPAALREKITTAVEQQLISDRPLGIYLSGGIDSSTVLDCVSRVRNKISSFSVGFDLTKEEQVDKFNQDFHLARRTARYYGTDHHEILVSAADLLHYFEKSVWHLDEPVANPTIIAMMKLASFTSDKVQVVLVGDGGDELFGGYKRYRLSRLISCFGNAAWALRPLLFFSRRWRELASSDADINGVGRYMLLMFQKRAVWERLISSLMLTDYPRQFFTEKFFVAGSRVGRDLEEMLMEIDRQTWLVDESLLRTDKTSMAFGLEARVPLLSRQVVEFSNRIRACHKVGILQNKIIMKQAFADRLPSFLLQQPKRGWVSPGAKWLRRPAVYEMVKSVLSPAYHSNNKNLFRWAGVEKILDDHYSKKEYNLTAIWALLTFQVWSKQYNVGL